MSFNKKQWLEVNSQLNQKLKSLEKQLYPKNYSASESQIERRKVPVDNQKASLISDIKSILNELKSVISNVELQVGPDYIQFLRTTMEAFESKIVLFKNEHHIMF